jgi:hypothetical protein
MLSSFYKLCCGILAVPSFRRHNFPSFPVRILPEGPRRLLAEDPDRIMHLDVFLFFWLLSLRPFPSIGCAAIPVRHLVLFCASPFPFRGPARKPAREAGTEIRCRS